MIKTVDNFISKNEIFENKKISISDNYYFEYSYKKDIENTNITLEAFKQNSNNILVFDDKKDDDNIILSIQQINNYHNIEVGNYIGKFKFNEIDIDIKSRFSDEFLTRMLNFANDVYLNDVSIFNAKEQKSKDIDYSKFVIYHLFIQRLEKAFLLGLPKSYQSIKNHDTKLRGRIDINRFIKHDIPFKGKISSISREQKEIQEIIDVLYKAVKIIEKNKFSTKSISHIKAHLKQQKSNNFVSKVTINKAMQSKALQNPIFTPYKKVLEYAKLIIDSNNIEEKKDANKQTYGFLINVAQLFEIYITKLLQKEFADWDISSPKIELYKDNFFARKIIPDIVMQKDNKLLVFDTKYKKMLLRGTKDAIWDLDRSDFFQINTYMSYYQNSGYKVTAGGLLYPMEEIYDENKCLSNTWLGNYDTKFVVDGIDLSKLNDNNIQKLEKDFIERVRKLLEEA